MVKVAITSQELIVLLSPQCFLLLAPQGLFQFPWPCCPAPFYWYKRIIELQFSVELRSRWDMAVKHTSSQQLTPPPPKIHLPWGLSSGAGGKESKKTLGAQCLLRWHCRFLGTPHAIKGSFVPRCNTPQRHLSKGCILNKKQHFPFWFLKVRLLSVMLQFMHLWQGNGTAAWGKKFFFPTLPLLCGNSSGSSHVHKLPPTWCGIIPLAFPVPLNHLFPCIWCVYTCAIIMPFLFTIQHSLAKAKSPSHCTMSLQPQRPRLNKHPALLLDAFCYFSCVLPGLPKCSGFPQHAQIKNWAGSMAGNQLIETAEGDLYCALAPQRAGMGQPTRHTCVSGVLQRSRKGGNSSLLLWRTLEKQRSPKLVVCIQWT